MKSRCNGHGDPKFHTYVERGISVCDRWLSFENFAEDMGSTFQPELELDRIDNNGDYEPGNCRWVDHSAQNRNKSTNHVVEWNGRAMTIQDWSEIVGIKPNTIIYRLRRGWTVEDSLTKPVQRRRIAND